MSLYPAHGQAVFHWANIVLGHLNHPPVTHVFGQLRDLIRARSLRTVTLDEVFIVATS
jgi:hypothetical protein